MRSKIAQQVLTDNGFDNVTNFGGLSTWQTKGEKLINRNLTNSKILDKSTKLPHNERASITQENL